MAFLPSLQNLALGDHRRQLDVAIRMVGLLLLPAPMGLTSLLIHLRKMPAPHRVAPLEFLLACGVMLSFWLAALLFVAGADLLRPVPRPPRPLNF